MNVFYLFERQSHNKRTPPPDFGRSDNGGGSADTPHYYSPPQIFKSSPIPGKNDIT